MNGWDPEWNYWHTCFSDEHYFATVLATQGLDQVQLFFAGSRHARCSTSPLVWSGRCADICIRVFRGTRLARSHLGSGVGTLKVPVDDTIMWSISQA